MSIVFFAVHKGSGYGVFGRNEWLKADFDRPVDGEVGIVPTQRPFHIRAIGRGDFVVKIGDIAQNKEAVRATWRNSETVVGFGMEHISVPYAVGVGAFTEINKDIEDRPRGDPYELALGGIARLIVETTEHMLGGAAVIVLNEVEIQTHIAKCLAIPRFHKETTGIAKDFWFQ